jgi:hypothetical protein
MLDRGFNIKIDSVSGDVLGNFNYHREGDKLVIEDIFIFFEFMNGYL